MDLRQKGDYGDMFDFEKESIIPLIDPVKELLDTIKRHIEETNQAQHPNLSAEAILHINYRKSEYTQIVTTEEIVQHDYDLQFSNYMERSSDFLETMTPSVPLLQECLKLEKELSDVKNRIDLLMRGPKGVL